MKSAVAAVALLWCALTYAQKSISARDAKDHVGQKATVCGKVASANYAVSSPGSPTFLNLDRAYPHQVFTIVIWGGDRSKFGDPEVSFAKKDICVTGEITVYRGKPETTAHEPSQITVQ